jgi:hypothetical protein
LPEIKAYLDKNPIPGIQFQSGAAAATYDQLARVHTHLEEVGDGFGEGYTINHQGS